MVWELGLGSGEGSRRDTATGCGAYQGGLVQSIHHAPRNHTGSSERSKRFFCRDGGKQNRGRWRDPG